MAKSAINRHHHDRMIKKRLTYPYWWRYKDVPERWNFIARTTVACSCALCGHRRKMDGPTPQERRSVAWIEDV